MKITLFIAFVIVSSTVFAGQKPQTVKLVNETGCVSLETQEKRVQLMSVVMQPKSQADKESAIHEIVALSNNSTMCTKDLTGTYPVVENQQHYVRVLVGKSKLWVMK